MQIQTSKTKFVIDSGEDWTEDKISAVYNEIAEIADKKYGYDIYPNQIDIITSEQMLDAYASNALPIYYNHWTYGKSFLQQFEMYKRGMMGLAYEVVINSNPCVSYLMEENTMVLQALVLAHAAIGHNHFYKNNYMMRKWTDASSIVPYLSVAKQFILECENKYGDDAVEQVLDSCHSWQFQSIDKYKRPPPLSVVQEEKRIQERLAFEHQHASDIWSTVPVFENSVEEDDIFPKEPMENILRFVEENSPKLENWKKGIIRIVRNLSQYYYPNMTTSVPNEGFACYVHDQIMNDLHAQGTLTDGAFLEYVTIHTNVLKQRNHDPRRTRNTGINVYPLGFFTMKDIERAAENPTDEDREWYAHQDWVGNSTGYEAIKWVVKNFKTDSFIGQFLHPKTMRKYGMYSILDDDTDEAQVVSAIQDSFSNYRQIRSDLSDSYVLTNSLPDIQVVRVDRLGDRKMYLEHAMTDRRPLDEDNIIASLKHLSSLWGYPVHLTSVDKHRKVHATYEVSGENNAADMTFPL